MARAESSDYLQSFRFHVRVLSGPDFLSLDAGPVGVKGEAGFQSVTLPEWSIEAAEYREGIYKFTKKFPGPPTVSDVTLMRGIVYKDTRFHEWAVAAFDGSAYRADFGIFHYHRADVPAGVQEAIADTPARVYKCYEGFPIRVKPAADFDATSGEVSMAEMDISIEYFEIVDLNAPADNGVPDQVLTPGGPGPVNIL